MDELTIGELSARSGVATSALRFYEAEGLIASRRTDGNQRRYARPMLRRVALIQAGRTAGISLERIRAALDAAAARAYGEQARLGAAVAGLARRTSTSGSRSWRRCATSSRRASAAAASRCARARSSTRATERQRAARGRGTCSATSPSDRWLG